MRLERSYQKNFGENPFFNLVRSINENNAVAILLDNRRLRSVRLCNGTNKTTCIFNNFNFVIHNGLF